MIVHAEEPLRSSTGDCHTTFEYQPVVTCQAALDEGRATKWLSPQVESLPGSRVEDCVADQHLVFPRIRVDDRDGMNVQTRPLDVDAVRALVLAAASKDADTAAHMERIRRYSEVVAKGLRLAPRDVELIREASPLHDIGKIGIPNSILRKPGPLTSGERRAMQKHTEIGARILQESRGEVLRMGRVIALCHHERWDGAGYPEGRAGLEIPLEARICGIVDVFDALTSNRCYRRALANDVVYAMMDDDRGKHFDPSILDVFFEHRPEIERIQRSVGAQSGLSPGGRRPTRRQAALARVRRVR